MEPKKLPERVAVLGGTGLLGCEVARKFIADGSSVVVVARNRPNGLAKEWLRPAEFILGSVTDPTIVQRALHEADHVVHAVGCPFPAESNRDPLGDIMQTLPGLIGVLNVLRQTPDVGFTFFSSGGTIYGNPVSLPVAEAHPCNPITAYGITKLTAEKYIGMYAQLYGINVRILRVSNAYGQRQSAARGQGLVAALLAAAESGEPLTVYGEGAIRDYIDVRDVASATVELAARRTGPQVVNVGTGLGHAVSSVIRAVETVVARPVGVIREEPRPFDVREIVLDVSVLRSLIPWAPIDLERGISDIWTARREPATWVDEDAIA